MHGGSGRGSSGRSGSAIGAPGSDPTPGGEVGLRAPRGPLLRLADGVVPLVIADRPALFVEATQRLNALNGSAGMLVALLADGIELAELRRQLQETMGLNAGEVDALVTDWSTQRVMAASFAPGAADAECLWLRAGERSIAIRFPQGAWGAGLAAPYGHLPRGGVPGETATSITVEALGESENDLVGVFDDSAGTLVSQDAASPVLRGAIVDLVLDQPGYVALHAACLVARDGPQDEAILLIGAPGAGKSTLAAMAAAASPHLRLAGDDIVLFDPRSGLVMGVPLPLTVKSGSWDRLAQVVPGLAALTPVRRADGQWLRYAPLPGSPGESAAPTWARVAGIVDLCRQDGAVAGLVPQSPIDCLGRLLEEGFVHDGRCTSAQMRGLARMVDNAETCTLRYAEAEQAAPWIEALLA